MNLPVHVERVGDEFTITTTIPPRRFGFGPNLGAMQRALNLLTALNPDAFDPVPVRAEEDEHHAIDAPMPPTLSELLSRAEDDDGPDGLKAGEAYRTPVSQEDEE